MKAFLFGIMFVVLCAAAYAAPLTAIYGTVTDASHAPVDGATVFVQCNHADYLSNQTVSTGIDGKYYAFFPGINCAPTDSVLVHASKGSSDGSNSSTVGFNEQCRINTSLINVTIPEFGVIAGGLALVGAIAGFLILRRH